MTCLKTGLYFHHGDLVYHCDMYGDLDNQIILLKGFAPQPTVYSGGYHVSWDTDNDKLVSTEKFSQFMKDWNDEYTDWDTWDWVIDDLFCRFSYHIHSPKA